MSTPTYSKITIDLLRHGHCADGKIYRGRTDSALSEQGWQQLQQQCNHAADQACWQQIISSPKQRCFLFAQQLATQLQLPLSVNSAFTEYDFGDWDGQMIADIWQQQPKLAQAFYDDPINNTPSNAEAMSVFLHRTLQGWQQLADKFDQQHVLVITHAGVIRALICQLLQIPITNQMNVAIDYAGLTRVHYFKDSQQAVFEFINRPIMPVLHDEQ